MKVAVTGANGFFAGYLIKKLLEDHNEVILLSRSSGEAYNISYSITDYSYKSLFEKLDGADAVVHLASPRAVFKNFCEYASAVEMTENLYSVANDRRINNIVYASSISVYSGESLPYRETDVPEPSNYYGLYKLICENIGSIYNERCGLFIKNLRLAHLYGANEKNNFMINVFLRSAFEHRPITVFGQGEARREMLYAKDAANAVLRALRRTNVRGTFNIGSNEYLTNSEIAEIICDTFSPELSVTHGNEKDNTASSYMSINKAADILDFVPQYTLKTALEEIRRDMSAVRG